MEDCIFCKIAAGQIPSGKVYEDDRCFAFRDINPQAPVHILIIPKEHMAGAVECARREDDLMGYLFKTAAKIAVEQGLDKSGFRLITNYGEHGAQTVRHFHIHLLGGRQLQGEMG